MAGRARIVDVVAVGFACAAVVVGFPDEVRAQLRVSPGPLARAHAALEGVANCGRCHDSVQGVSPTRCLSCHKPIAARIAARTGVHRDAAGTCGTCHEEHRGPDADLKPIDPGTFKHAAETGFALDGLHLKVAAKCAACHKTRSFLTVRPSCDACHTDVHKGTLGVKCTACHSVEVAFKETRRRFDHAGAQFPLTGAHATVPCEKCHPAGKFRGLRFDACSTCHQVPHRRTLGPECTTCHVTARWATRTVDHAKTAFPLVGAHTEVACAKCHPSGVRTAVPFDRCSACHADVHRASVKGDCGKCHKETRFREATFDHAAGTAFPLTGKHESLACRKCHDSLPSAPAPLAQTVIDFSGPSPACATCHKDEHKGEYGRLCDACHRSVTFRVAGFAHPRLPAFFAGRHDGVKCARCHVRPGALQASEVAATGAPGTRPPPTVCSACHTDVHLGQVGEACERCHTVDGARFAATRFSHDAATFPLTGRHRGVECSKCHALEQGAFPAGTGTAPRLRPVSSACRACHEDRHLGQVDTRCETCHTTAAPFAGTAYPHPGQEYTFSIGSHSRLSCKSCHKVETGRFPAGWGTAMRLKVGKTCMDCHG